MVGLNLKPQISVFFFFFLVVEKTLIFIFDCSMTELLSQVFSLLTVIIGVQ
jgi:hypothetical protein